MCVFFSDNVYIEGKIAFANVVSDIYSCGVVEIDELKIVLSMPDELSKEEQMQVSSDIIDGFRESAKLVKCKLTIERININPWCMIGGIASAIVTKNEMIFPTQAAAGDTIILTKPLGVQLATNAHIWLEEKSENWQKLSSHLSDNDIIETYNKALKSMQMLNYVGAKLMQKFKAHCSTDVTGFGLVGHAENLLEFQDNNVNFIITHMPIIKHVKKMSEILNRQKKMLDGRMVETSGGLFICLPTENAQSFCEEFNELSGENCWIIGRVEEGNKKVIFENVEFIEV